MIISDSKSSLQAMKDIYSRNPLIQNIHSLLNKSQIIFKFIWIPSHFDIDGNYKDDALAKSS